MKKNDDQILTEPIINGTTINKDIYKCFNNISNNIGSILTEYHWREVCDLMKRMEDEKLIEIKFPY